MEANEPPSDVVPHPETTNSAPSGNDMAEEGIGTGEALRNANFTKVILLAQLEKTIRLIFI